MTVVHMENAIWISVMFACGFWGFRIATNRQRNRVIAVLVGAGFGLIGLGIYALVTRKSKPVPSAQTELAPMI